MYKYSQTCILFIWKSKNCQQIHPETSIVFYTLSTITELTQQNVFALKVPPSHQLELFQ